MNATELYESLVKELPNRGAFKRTNESGQLASKNNLLTAIARMQRAKMADENIKDIILDLYTDAFAEHSLLIKPKPVNPAVDVGQPVEADKTTSA